MQCRTETCEMSNEERIHEAKQLFQSAKAKLAKGDLIGAEKRLLQAECLHHNPHAEDMLNQIQNRKAKNAETNIRGSGGRQQSDQITDPNTSSSEEKIRRQSTSSQRSADQDYTREQLEAVRRVFKCQTYYEILIVTPNASLDEIKDAYKRQALLVHPDKNKAPGANKAFQAVGAAKDVLTNPTKRYQYDMQRQQEYRNVADMPERGDFDIPTWMVVGGVAIFAAGLFGVWWSGRQEKKQQQSSQDDEMSDDD